MKTKTAKIEAKEKPTNINVVDKQDRGKLIEGRDNGMAFGFLKKVGDNKYETVMPPSPCKDYLAEVIITEWNDVPTRACGFNYPKKNNIFDDVVAYMLIKLLPIHGSNYYGYSPSITEDNKKFANNYPIMQAIMNKFEDDINLGARTIIEKVDDKDEYVVTIPIEWCKSTPAISLYALLLRVLMVADKEEDMITFLKSYKYHRGDSSFIRQTINKIELILREKQLPPNRIPYSLAKLKAHTHTPHNNGIVSWDCKFEEVKLVD